MISRESLKKHWKEVEAFKDGKVIEYASYPLGTSEISWGVVHTPSWGSLEQYRVKPEFHSELREAYKNGASIQYWDTVFYTWSGIEEPNWNEETQYRIKPKESKLNKIRWLVEIIAHSQGKAIEISFDSGLSWDINLHPKWKLGHLYRVQP